MRTTRREGRGIFRARFVALCPVCRSSVMVGTRAAYRAGRVVHAACRDELAPP